jgi:hypothetical protein
VPIADARFAQSASASHEAKEALAMDEQEARRMVSGELS